MSSKAISNANHSVTRKTKCGSKTRVKLNKQIPDSETSDYSDNEIELNDHSIEEMLDLSERNEYPKKRFRFGSRVRGYTAILHFFKCPQVA